MIRLFLILMPLYLWPQKSKRILFIGNSYTYVNNLPQIISNLALANGDTLVYDSNTPGGYTLQMHCTDPVTLSKIALGIWDYVVLQCQSQEPSFDSVQVASNVMPYAHKLDSLIHLADTCVETVFYMTWGRKNGDAGNCIVYPPVCTYSGMQERLRQSYLLMGHQNSATVSPVGCVWREVRNLNPTFDLYLADESHPSEWGSYLAAATFYRLLFQKKVSAINYNFILPSGDAQLIRQVTDQYFSDSLSSFVTNGNIPFSSFQFSENSGFVNLTNQSLNAQNVIWDYGDGNTSTQWSPQHNYTMQGVYTICLTTLNDCREDVLCDTVQVLSVGVEEINDANNFQIATDFNSIRLSGNVLTRSTVEIYTIEGKLIQQYEVKGNWTIFFCCDPGFYIVRVNAGDSIGIRKFVYPHSK
jgi:hypothetical protein